MKAYGCNNRAAFLPSLLVQDGWRETVVPGDVPGRTTRVRLPRLVAVSFRMSEGCQYVPPRAPDPGCTGCRRKSAQHELVES